MMSSGNDGGREKSHSDKQGSWRDKGGENVMNTRKIKLERKYESEEKDAENREITENIREMEKRKRKIRKWRDSC